MNQKRRYTSYERDGNGGDEAQQRRYERWHSRFYQPDPSDGSYDLTNPQSLNRYSYVENDPVSFTDPTGLFRAAPGIGTFVVTVGISWSDRLMDYYDAGNGGDFGWLSDGDLGGTTRGDDWDGVRPGGAPQGEGRIPRCPPTARALSRNNDVKQALQQAFADSFVGAPHEEGGWLYMDNSTGKVNVVRAVSGGSGSINLSNPLPRTGQTLVGNFHTHAHNENELIPGTTDRYGSPFSPSDADIRNAERRNMPGLIATFGNQIRAYGPNRLGQGDPHKTANPTEVPGYLGNGALPSCR